jgi:GTPase SAR1 family protein
MQQAKSIQVTRQEILALLREQRARIEKMLAMDLLRERGAEGEVRSFDRQSAQRLVGILENEISKVDRLEMVLAVVGTMKAGKSTVINAIVGSEVLPNRNQPMTSLPTLIRHTPGRQVPLLRFPKPAPIARLISQLHDRLGQLEQAGRLEELDLYAEDDGSDLIQRILEVDEAEVPAECEGQLDIFAFLRDLNDVARLATDPAVGLRLPLEEYQAVDDLPVIEVEFTHLADAPLPGGGTFSLLDTPGHNEFGASAALMRIVRDQLARASAVLAVLDYTQLKSEAEEEVRQELVAIAGQTDDRLFLLVNKFDQRDRHGMTADELRRHVSGALMDGRVDALRVFPVSARYAYLANMALSSLNEVGVLPDSKANAWVEDFGHLALGGFWEEQMANPAKVRAAATKLWQRSQFDLPIRQVVRKAGREAAIITLRAAIAKLAEHGRTIDNFMQLRRGALERETDEVHRLVAGLEQDIGTVDAMRSEAAEVIRQVTQVFETFIDALQSETMRRLDLALVESLGSLARAVAGEDPTMTVSSSEPRSVATSGLGRPGGGLTRPAAAFGRRGMAAGKPTVAPGAIAELPVVRLNSPEEAEAVARRLGTRIQSLFETSVRAAAAEFTRTCGDLQSSVGGALRSHVSGLLERAQSRLSEKGIRLALDFPAPDLATVAADFAVTIGSMMARRTEKRVGKRERGGLGAEMGRLLWGSDSGKGYETFTYTDVYYEIDANRLRGRLATDFDGTVLEMRRKARDFVRETVEPTLEDYFGALTGFLEGFRGDLLDGIADRSLDPGELAALADQIDHLAAAGLGSAEGILAAEQGLAAAEQEIPASAPPQLLLIHSGAEIPYDGVDGPLTIGRSPDSTIVLTAAVASRNHADIVLVDGRFVLNDHSTNGTFVAGDGGEVVELKHDSIDLPAAGLLHIGAAPGDKDAVAIEFRVG